MPVFKNEVTLATDVAIVGVSKLHHGVAGESKEDGAGVIGVSVDGEGVSGFSANGNGVVGQGDAKAGVVGLSKAGFGVQGLSVSGDALRGISDSGAGLNAQSHSGVAVTALSDTASAVRAVSKSGRGVEGWSESSYGVSGDSSTSAGVRGTSKEGRGVEGWSTRSEGVVGISDSGTGVWGVAGRSPAFGKIFDTSIVAGVLDVGTSAKRWLTEAQAQLPLVPPNQPDPPPEWRTLHATLATPDTATVGAAAADHLLPASGPGAMVTNPMPHAVVSPDNLGNATLVGGVADIAGTTIGDAIAGVHDNNAGIGVFGEHRGGGIGVKGLSRAGVGVDAYSESYEAIHAATNSRQVAAIAAYNIHPRATGAAVYARKVGPLGHAGFFDGRVWISSELAVGGDILLANADCAEDFDVVSLELAEPGTVMVIGEDGVLHPCTQAYDKRVAGVISGAGRYKPGLILDKQSTSGERSPIALMGKVCCKVTTENGAIEIGDLLTTSNVSGHAMKAGDAQRAFGAVIGKALEPLSNGTGLVSILIALV